MRRFYFVDYEQRQQMAPNSSQIHLLLLVKRLTLGDEIRISVRFVILELNLFYHIAHADLLNFIVKEPVAQQNRMKNLPPCTRAF